jgi:hypothetical protein
MIKVGAFVAAWKEELMASRIFWNERRLSGVLLTLGALLFSIAVVSRMPGANITAYLTTQAWGSMLLVAAVLVTVLGLATLVTLLREAGVHILARLGLIGFLYSAVLGALYFALKAGAAEAARWIYALVLIYNALAFLSVTVYGGALLRTRLLPRWIEWASIAGSIVLLVVSLILLEYFPAFPGGMLLTVGILLLLRKYPIPTSGRTEIILSMRRLLSRRLWQNGEPHAE